MSASSTEPVGNGASDVVPFVWNRRVEFCETDAAGIVHFSAFLQYMEQAEHALFRDLGTSIFPAGLHDSCSPDHQANDPTLTWPRVRCECEYFAAARFEEMIQIRVFVERLGAKSVTYRHEMQVADRLVARGRITAVCCRHAQGKLVGYPIPDSMRESLSRYLLPSNSTSS